MSENLAQVFARVENKSKESMIVGEAIVKNLELLLTKRAQKSILWNSGCEEKIKHRELVLTEC